jgi:glycosyltransferase involved in cell wall biosynthesis
MDAECIPISVLIFTKNEEADLPGCLASFAWCDDIHVCDSGSTDGTQQVVLSHGAHFTTKTYGDNLAPFGGDESAHKNWALRTLPFKHPWVFHSDADERATPELVLALSKFVRSPGPHVALRVRRRDYFMGTWLKHVAATPFYIRMFQPSRVRFERVINPVTLVDGPIADSNSHFNHFPFSKGLTHWIARHNAYSTAEAEQIIANRHSGTVFSLRKALSGRDANERRFHQKELYYRLPFRPLLMFLLLYVGKRGFLDGRAGLTYGLLRAMYEYMIVLKVREHDLAA